MDDSTSLDMSTTSTTSTASTFNTATSLNFTGGPHRPRTNTAPIVLATPATSLEALSQNLYSLFLNTTLTAGPNSPAALTLKNRGAISLLSHAAKMNTNARRRAHRRSQAWTIRLTARTKSARMLFRSLNRAFHAFLATMFHRLKNHTDLVASGITTREAGEEHYYTALLRSDKERQTSVEASNTAAMGGTQGGGPRCEHFCVGRVHRSFGWEAWRGGAL